ncbi:MAG: metal ABC transporter permease [Clostridia bacterium]|nr:metal ABC transporter permease [Clostridia bacterium]
MLGMFSYGFILRAAVVGTLVSLCASLLGVCLVQKRFSMIGDGLSHVGFGALAVAAALGLAPLKVAVPVVIVAAVILLRFSENGKIKGDASIAVFSTGALAIGVMAVSLSDGLNTDLYNYMFGSILAMSNSDVLWSIILAVLVILTFVLFYNRIFSVIFDEEFAKATGIKTSRYNMLIAILTAVTVVLGMRMMGTMLISGLIIFPALTAKQIFKGFRGVIICSAAVSVFCFLAGLTASFYLSTPTGASIVIVNIIVFLIFGGASILRGRLS